MSKPFTDTPWHSDGRMILSETADSIVAMVATGAEDRDFIIQAVNAHVGLVEALSNILIGMEASGGWEGDDELFQAGMGALAKAGVK